MEGRGERHRVRPAMVGVLGLGAIRRHLDLVLSRAHDDGAEAVVVQPNASVTVTVYEPLHKSTESLVVADASFQRYEKGAVPPITLTIARASQEFEHDVRRAIGTR